MRGAWLARRVGDVVSMKSGLEGRNNASLFCGAAMSWASLNEVRPRRPEQCIKVPPRCRQQSCLNEVRPRRPEQFSYSLFANAVLFTSVSMKSGLEGRNNNKKREFLTLRAAVSQ